MFNSKSKISKIVGYGVIGFFILIIVIAFGMPDFMTNFGDQPGQYAAIVNGENITRIDFLRYKERRMPQMKDMKKEMIEMYSSMILSEYIQSVLLKQMGRKLGIFITEDRRDDLIMGIQSFQNPQTGKFEYDIFLSAVRQQHYTEMEFKKYVEQQMIIQDVSEYISAATAVTSDELKKEYIAQHSALQVSYAFVSTEALKILYKNRLTVTDEEIKAEMVKKSADIKDPKSDKERIKTKLEKQKLDAIKHELAKGINDAAAKGGSFVLAASLLPGAEVSTSAEFKPGESVKDIKDAKKNLFALYNAPEFFAGCLKLKPGTASKAINSVSGIYVFTPLKINIYDGPIDEKKRAELEKKMLEEQFSNVQQNILKKMFEESKIKRFEEKKS